MGGKDLSKHLFNQETLDCCLLLKCFIKKKHFIYLICLAYKVYNLKHAQDPFTVSIRLSLQTIITVVGFVVLPYCTVDLAE